MNISLISTLEFGETSTIHIKIKNVVILTGNDTDEIAEELFDFLFKKYQEGLKENIKKVTMLLTVLMLCIIKKA